MHLQIQVYKCSFNKFLSVNITKIGVFFIHLHLLSGGNIDVSFIQCIIEQGLVSRHRRLRFTVTLLDRPGSLGKLLNDIAALGANILSVEHDRLTAGLNPNEIDVHVSCEVGGKEHGDRVLDQLIQNGYHVKID